MIHRLACVTVWLGFWVLSAPPVLAQQAESSQLPQSEPPDQQALAVEAAEEPADEAGPVEEIVVTGSRIRRTAFSSTSPVTVITGERSALAGLLDTTDILQSSTIASGQQIDDSFSGFVTDGGPGANTLSLRGLGAQRTLILVNGKRWGSSGVRGSTNSVDLTAIPSSIVSRIEILKDGASSVYGADAVAGVVNVITKTRQDGLQVNAAGAFPADDGGDSYGIDAVWGRIGGDWSFHVAAEYTKQQELRQSQRDWAACNRRPRLTDQDGDGNIDNRDPATGEELCFGVPYGFAVSPFGWLRYDPSLGPGADPATPSFDPQLNGALGIPYFTREPAGPLDNQGAFYRDTRSPRVAQMYSESDLFSVTAYADKDFTLFGNDANAFLEFYYNQRDTRASGGYRQFFEPVPASNPTNPFGDQGPLPAALGLPAGVAVQPVLMSYGLLDPDTQVDIWRYNLLGGVEGELFSNWSYNGHLGYSYSKGSYETDNWLNDRVVASLDATLDDDGNLVCRQLDRHPGCVAANLFTAEALLQGTLPADYVAYVSKVTRGETIYKGWQASGYVTGTLFSVWDDEAVSLVVGGEVRREEIDDEPDPESQNDNVWGSSSALVTAGKDTVREMFVELELPLLPPNTPWAEEVMLNLSSRFTDYNSYGDDWTERVQLSWQLNPLLRVRGTYGTSFRAPDLFEQFLGNETGFLDHLIDPCVQYGEDYDPGDPIYDNCASLGLPPDHGSEGGPGVRSVTGGNPDLQAETSDSWTAGLVLSPERLGASLALNFFEIELKNTVASPGVGYVLSQCLNSAGLGNPFCSRIAPRNADGFLTDVDASLLNIGVQRSRGVDVDILYERPFSRFDLAVDLSATHLKEQYLELLGQEYELAGRWGLPEWSAQLDFYVDWRDWRFLYRMGYLSHTREERQFDPDTTDVDRIRRTPAKDYHTLSARYTSPNDWQVIATVRNLFDSDPPIVSDQGSNSARRFLNTIPGAGYDLLGRTFVLQISKGF